VQAVPSALFCAVHPELPQTLFWHCVSVLGSEPHNPEQHEPPVQEVPSALNSLSQSERPFMQLMTMHRTFVHSVLRPHRLATQLLHLSTQNPAP